ncbi:MAG: CDP-diacylglycerol--serine O-phosphatidyltransferase [Gammaproteobacteria bacterium]|nr:CDP-diacylglycerol--serine O-phosphatidyltransferase [Gammaproteobacteria bacterium]
MKRKLTSRTVRLKRGIYLLPNLFTTAALFAGFFAVIVAMKGDFQAAAIAILVAMVLDGMDGRVARLTHTETDFGKEFDSMSDMVSFGLAPALVVYQWGVQALPVEVPIWGRIGWLAAFFYTVAAALRLARFNSNAPSKNDQYFQGLPSPSAAGLVGSALWLTTEYQLAGPVTMASAFALSVITGALMVSNFPYRSFKDFDLVSRVGFRHLLLVPLFFMVVAIDPPLILTLLFLTYAASGPLLYLWKKARGIPMDMPPILWFSDLKKNPDRKGSTSDKDGADDTATGTDDP